MRQTYYFLFALCLAVLLSSAALAKTAESVSIPLALDKKPWIFGSQTQMGTFYVPKGQTIQNWTELITVQFYPNYKNTPAKVFMTHFLARLHKNEPTVKSKYIVSTDTNAIAEWSMLNSKRCPNQCGLDRALKGPGGLHIVHYAVKTDKWPSAQRNLWLNIIGKTKVTKAQ